MTDLAQSLRQAAWCHKEGHSAEAAQLCRAVLAAKPDFHAARHLLGLALAAQGRLQEALDVLDQVASNVPSSAPVLKGRAEILDKLDRSVEVLETIERALAITPDDAVLWNRKGLVLRKLNRAEDALASFDQAHRLRPGEAMIEFSRGINLVVLGRDQEALSVFDGVQVSGEEPVEVLLSRGLALLRLDRAAESLVCMDTALVKDPQNIDAQINRGNALWRLGRLQEALECYTAVLERDPDNVPVLNNKGVLLTQSCRGAEAITALNLALAARPGDLQTLLNRGLAYCSIKGFSDALVDFTAALEISPGNRVALAGQAIVAAYICDFDIQETLRNRVVAPQEDLPIPLLVLLGYCGDAELLFDRASAEVCRISTNVPLKGHTRHNHKRLRLAYLSPDFRRHPVAQQVVEVLERHDRSRFEVIGVALRPGDGSDIRGRIRHACDQFYEVHGHTDRAVAEMLREAEIDIAIDLAGHTEGARLAIFAYRPAPVQVSWLGYAGTTGANFIDYVIADPVALPMDQQPFFSERIVHLPNSFWASDTTRPVKWAPSRAEAGLPAQGVVLAALNRFNKFNRGIFASWMEVMAAVTDSVLWLPGGEEAPLDNLRREAHRCGIDVRRLIEAPRLPKLADHLARLSLADIFLDTAPYNGHTSASDALWAGVPVVTMRGTSFAGRVAASLLHAIGLPELVTDSLKEYEELACRLARDQELLQSLRNTLEQKRLTHPLFDIDRFRRDIETAYITMWEISQQGEPPKAFAVPPASN